jgi:phosphotransferase system enzyme I (PtsP)
MLEQARTVAVVGIKDLESEDAYRILMQEMSREQRVGRDLPTDIRVGAMLETPSLAFAPKKFFEMCDFVSIGGNDLKQFFYAADRENERVRRRYDTLNVPFLALLRQIVLRCEEARVPLSFCGEDAGRPIEALTFAALGIRRLSMRPASIGPVKHLIRRVSIADLRQVIDEAEASGMHNLRRPVTEWLARQ